jgi:predicted RNA methylase
LFPERSLSILSMKGVCPMPVGTLENLSRSAFVRTPPSLAERIVRNLLSFPEGKATNVLDPTAGEGDLLLPCCDHAQTRLYGVEISAERADLARRRLPRAEIVACAFEGVSIPKASMSLVLANPPYFFQDGKRAEYRILADAGTLLMPGGVLVAIIPARSAWDGTMVNHWCHWYERVRVWKFPDRTVYSEEGAFHEFTQICVIGIRRAEPIDPMPAEQRRLAGFRYHVAPANATPSARLRVGWEGGAPPPELPTIPDPVLYVLPEARSRVQIVVRHAAEAMLLAALERQGAHLTPAWEQATTWEQDVLRGQPVMPLSGEAHVAAEVLTGLLDGEIICGPGDGSDAAPHLLTAFVGREWMPTPIDAEEQEKLREHGVVSVQMRQYQDKPILGILNLATGETRYEQGEAVFTFLAPWLAHLAARVVARRQPRYRLDPADWELRVLSQFGQDKQLPNAAFAGLSAAQQHRVYAMGRALDQTGCVAIQGEPGVGKTRLTTAAAARMAYQWRHRNGPDFVGQKRQPAWMAGLRRAWLKNPRTLALLGLSPVTEPETGRIIAYRRTDGTHVSPEDAGPQALPVLVVTPKKVTKEFGHEIRAAWQASGAEVVFIESHRDIPQWFKRCAESAAPAVIGIVPHSLTRAFGREWHPALLEKQVTRDVPVTEPEAHLLPRLVEAYDERHQRIGYRWRATGELYTKLVTETHFCCPGCGGLIRAIPGKLHEVEKKLDKDEETSGLQLLLSSGASEALLDEDRAVPVTSRTYFTLKQRWCQCNGDARNATPDGRTRVRTPLWSEARRPDAQRKHPQLGYASFAQAIERVQQQARERAAQATTSDLLTLARRDEEVLRRIMTAAACGEMDEASIHALRNNLPALTTRIEAARPALALEACCFRLAWDAAFQAGKGHGKGKDPVAALSLEVAASASVSPDAPARAGKGQQDATRRLVRQTQAERLAARRQALVQQRREREHEQYVRFQPLPDSFSPYDYLFRWYKGCVALAIIDESHNGRGRDTDIAHAFHQAMLASQTRLFSTGTHYGGSVLDFYHYWYRFNPAFWQRLGLGWNDADKALERYGVVQEWVKEYESDARRGSGQTTIQVSTIPAPGLSAKLIPSLLEDLCYLTVLDVGAHMPPRMEFPEIVSMRDPQLEATRQMATDARAQAKRTLDEVLGSIRRTGGTPPPHQQSEQEQAEHEYRAAVQRLSDLDQAQSPYHLAKHYGALVGRLEDLAKERNQAARLAKGTVPRWFAVLPCDTPFEVWQTKRGDWGDETERECIVSTPRLAWDYLYPLEKRLIALVEQERAEGRRVMIYYEQNAIRSMSRRLAWVLREFHPWTLPNTVASEDRQQAILDAVLNEGHEVIIVPYRRVNEGLNLQSAIDTILWFEMALNLFMLDQASRRAWRLGKREEVHIYYLTYAHTVGHTKLRRLGLQSGAAAAFAGEPARGALIHEAGADQTTLARLSSMLETDDREDASLLLERADDDGTIAEEEVALKAVFRRRAEELQAALKAGRTFLGGIEDTLSAQLASLMQTPAFISPVWDELPVHRSPIGAAQEREQLRKDSPTIVESLPTMAHADADERHATAQREAACGLPAGLTPLPGPAPQPATQREKPVAVSAPAPAPAPAPAQSPQWVFGDATHIQLARTLVGRKKRGAVEHPKRRMPVVERDIPALDEQALVQVASRNGNDHATPQVLLPSLWDVLTASTSLAPAAAPSLSVSRSSSAPRQTSLWD